MTRPRICDAFEERIRRISAIEIIDNPYDLDQIVRAVKNGSRHESHNT
jgi:hypothetical protein